MALIVVPYPLREKLGEEAADALVTLINEADEDNKESVIELAEQRFERRLAEELAKFRVEVNEAISRVRTELLGEIGKLRQDMVEGQQTLRGELLGEIGKLRQDMVEGHQTLRGELLGEIGKLRQEIFGEIAKLRVEMHDLRASLIQWMFIFWLGQIGVIAGLLFAFLRK